MVKITFPDGNTKDFKDGITGLEIAQSISEGLARMALVIKVDAREPEGSGRRSEASRDKVWDLSREIKHDASIRLLTFKDPEGIEVFRHSTAHVLADAVTQLYPYAKLTIGPVVDEGFYYDIDHEPFTPEDLPKIEAKMKEIVNAKQKFVRKEISKQEALQMFLDNPYKTEMIRELEDETITIYQHGEFVDLCRGAHVQHTGQIKAFKLTKIAGAYWRADAKNKMLQRIYGISFADKKDLKAYLDMIEEAKKRNHVKIGKQLDLFSIHEEGPGFPFFHDNGMYIYNKLVDFMREEMRKRNYEENKTPIILNKALWLQSGHWDHYKENMYFTKIDQGEYAVKPMNCPGNLLVYKNSAHSYRELPIRAGEFGLVHRHEMSGVLNGLFRVRVFTQDDAHVFCTEEQLTDELVELIKFVEYIYKTFGFEYHMELSTKPEKAMGSQKVWDHAESALKDALEKTGNEYQLNPGDGAFYGPKIDFHLKDALGRTWQCGTIQVDFSMPEKFNLEYDGADGQKHRPVMAHRAIYGSLERFLGILIEHYAGRFPLWLSPRQVSILSVSNKSNEYASEVRDKLFDAGFRVELDTRAESIPKKVRDAQISQFNYILVCGEKDQSAGTVTPRTREGEVQSAVKIEEFIAKLKQEVEAKK